MKSYPLSPSLLDFQRIHCILKAGKDFHMLVPADATPIGPGKNTGGEFGCAFYVRTSVLDRLEKDGPAWKFHDARLLPGLVQEPEFIFAGLNRPEFEDGYCYSARPEFRWINGQTKERTPEGMFFLGYIEAMSGSMVVLDWAWRPEDPHKPGYPTGWNDFEKGMVWPLQSP